LFLFGFPWILSSESRLINGLHGGIGENTSRCSPPFEGPTGSVSQAVEEQNYS
jgi:hypothetical protein